MKKQNYQIIKSLLAIVLCVAFLWTGKKYIWNQEPAPDPLAAPDTPPIAEITDLTTTTSTTAATTLTDSTTSSVASFDDTATTSTSTETTVSSTVTVTTTTAAASEGGTVTIPQTDGMTDAPEGYFDDALFIGDSRMVGLALWGRFPNATYFASTGLDTYKIDKAKSEVEGTKGKKFETVLAEKEYGKVYIMLGINELGYDRTKTKQNYMSLVSRIKTACPDAIIYVHANLHVSHKRADRDSIVNNVQINEYNSFLQALADNERVFYLDVNPLFDAEDGYLKSEYTNDGVHPFAKHYAMWKDYLMTHVIVK